MLNVRETLWAVAEIFGDRRDIVDGLSFIGAMVFGFGFLIFIWG